MYIFSVELKDSSLECDVEGELKWRLYRSQKPGAMDIQNVVE